MGWNAKHSASGSWTSGNDTTKEYVVTSATATLGVPNAECYNAATGERGPATSSSTVTLSFGGVSASVTVNNSVDVTTGSSGDKYPVSSGQPYTFTFPSPVTVDANTTVGWSASWGGTLASRI